METKSIKAFTIVEAQTWVIRTSFTQPEVDLSLEEELVAQLTLTGSRCMMIGELNSMMETSTQAGEVLEVTGNLSLAINSSIGLRSRTTQTIQSFSLASLCP